MNDFIEQESYRNEIWIPVTELMVPNVKPYYLVSTYGRVFSIFSNRLLSYHYSGRGYVSVRLAEQNGHDSINVYVHRLVMLGFCYIANYYELQVNHIDGNKLNNHLRNLEWVTNKENMQLAFETGLNHKGEDHYASKLTNEQVHIICNGLSQNMAYKHIAENAGLEFTETTNKCISDIKARKIWKDISNQYTFPIGRSNQLFTDNQIHMICKCLEAGLKNNQILNTLGINYNNHNIIRYNMVIDRVRARERFTKISKDYNF